MKPPFVVTCAPSVNQYRLSQFNVRFHAGKNVLNDMVPDKKVRDVLIYMLMHPFKFAPVDPVQCVLKGYLTLAEVKGLGYNIENDPELRYKLDEEQLNVEPMAPEIEFGEHPIDPDVLSRSDLMKWCDDEDHPVKYKHNWPKHKLAEVVKAKMREMEADE